MSGLHMITLLFWDVTQRRLVAITDVSGQPICPIFKGEAYLLYSISRYYYYYYYYYYYLREGGRV